MKTMWNLLVSAFFLGIAYTGLDQRVQAQAPPSLRTRPAPNGASDWETFLGPLGNGISSEKGVPDFKGTVALPLLWSRSLGEGYAPPAVSKGRLFLSERVRNQMRIFALNAETGKELWTYEYATQYRDKYGYDGGARACPVVSGNRVFHLGPEGVFTALAADTGALLWSVDAAKQFGIVQNFFGVGSAPCLFQDMVIIQAGGSPPGSTDDDFLALKGNGTGLVAFDQATGAVRWKSTDALAGYASPTIHKLPGFATPQVLLFARQGLYGVDAATGKESFSFPWRASIIESVNATNPIVSDGKVLLSECYGPGGVLLKLENGKPSPVWSDEDRGRAKALQIHWSTPILKDGVVYASSGRHEGNAELRAVDFATGKVRWRVPGLGRCSLLLIEDKLLVLGERGNLHWLQASPTKVEEVARLDPIDKATQEPLVNYPAWAGPVLSHGLLYLRGRDKLICLELIPAKK